MRETDRRVIYTKKLLRESLMSLMVEKPVGRISVTELCKGAGVNRGTFYSHYREPEDVLRDIEAELVSSVKDILDTMNSITEIHRAIVYALHRNRDACRLLISPNGDPGCISSMLQISIDYYESHTRPQLKLNAAENNYLHAFLFSGTVAVLREWLTSDPGRTPDEVADMLISMQTKLMNNN